MGLFRLSLTVEVREEGGELHGVLVQEGRAASGGRSELFAPGSISWPADGVGILCEHHGEPQTRAYPHRDQLGRINVRAQATAAIKDAISAGKKYMSVEFRSLDERVTRGGVREILSAYVAAAALVTSPEYDSSAAELRQRKRRRLWL